MNLPAIHPYLFFGGRCQEALDFYQSALGATIDMVLHFRESPDPVPEGMLAPGFENKVMHSSFHIGDAMIMASDGCAPGESFRAFSLALSVATVDEAQRMFNGLANGGTVTMPLTKTFWSPCYGMLKDRFDVEWMVMVPGEGPPPKA